MKPFGFEIDLYGARVVLVKEPICPGCLSDQEVDSQINRLKNNLDEVASKMKKAIREQQGKPLFGKKENL